MVWGFAVLKLPSIFNVVWTSPCMFYLRMQLPSSRLPCEIILMFQSSIPLLQGDCFAAVSLAEMVVWGKLCRLQGNFLLFLLQWGSSWLSLLYWKWNLKRVVCGLGFRSPSLPIYMIKCWNLLLLAWEGVKTAEKCYKTKAWFCFLAKSCLLLDPWSL